MLLSLSLPLRRVAVHCPRAVSIRPADQRAVLHSPCGPIANMLCTPVWANRSAGDRVPLIWQVTRGPPVHPPLQSGSVPFPPNVDPDSLDGYTWGRLRPTYIGYLRKTAWQVVGIR